MNSLLALAADPAAWIALITLIAMELVLGIDNLIFISILTNRLPEERRRQARRVGIVLALLFRLALLGTIAIIVRLTDPVFTLLGRGLSWRDLILLAGGLFLIWKATKEIHHNTDPDHAPDLFERGPRRRTNYYAAIAQIVVIDIVFSVDSIITAVGMTDHIAIMFIAVIVTVAVMLVAADPLARFIQGNPSLVMLALGFLLLIGTALVADAFGVHVPKGYIYCSMAFSIAIELLNMRARRRHKQASGSRPD